MYIAADVDYTYVYTMSKISDIPYLVVIVHCTHIGSATASFEDLVTLHRRTLQPDILIEDQVLSPLDMVTIGQEQEQHK